MKHEIRLISLFSGCLLASLLAGCGSNNIPDVDVKHETIVRAQSATMTLATDQHAFRFDGRRARTFTTCQGTVCGVSPTADGLQAALDKALADPRNPTLNFGSDHFALRLEDSLEVAMETRVVNGVTLIEGHGQRAGNRPFNARFFGVWLDDGAFFVNENTLTVRDERGQPDGLGTVFDASALGIARDTAPVSVQGMSASWTGMMIGVDVSDTVTRGQFLGSDATLVIENLDDPALDITFSDFWDLETGAMLADRMIAAWQDIPLDGGSFGDKPVGSGDYIQGQFVGEDHAGVVGIFERSNVLGSFGGARQPDD